MENKEILQKTKKGNYVMLPKCLFPAPEGKIFKCWSVNGKEYPPGTRIKVTDDMKVVALWKDDDTKVEEASKEERPLTKKELKRKQQKEEERQERIERKKRDLIYRKMTAEQRVSLKKEKIAPKDSYISLQHVNKIYPNAVQAVFDFNLEIKEKEFIVFVGPSGCGKSTTLRMIAGLEEITGGDLYIDGEFANELEPKDRDVAMVFQSYALYPHMTAYDNMAFGLKMRHIPKEEIDERVHKAAKILELTDYLDRKPKALSGGQCQRVALGRLIVRNAKVFLMDEPLSNLDAKLRVQMRSELVKLHNALGSTTIYVTHDQTEAMTMATRIVVMNKGHVQQIDEPKAIYDHPANTFVATFIGSPAMNIVEGVYSKKGINLKDIITIPVTKEIIEAHDAFYRAQIEKSNACIEEIIKLMSEAEVKEKEEPYNPEADPEIIKLREDIAYYQEQLEAEEHPILFGIRPEDVSEKEAAVLVKNQSQEITLPLTIAELLGNEYYAHLNFGGVDLISKVNAEKKLVAGDQVSVIFNLNKVSLFDVRSGKNIQAK